MCLILVAWRELPDYPLIVAANRDEYHARAARTAGFWEDRPAILAGRDLQAMGTWMGVSRQGKFGAVTNYRGAREPSARESRGALVTGFLQSAELPGDYVRETASRGAAYSGFNLLVADERELWWLSNRNGGFRCLEPGLYGLANELLDSPDVAVPKARVRNVIDAAPSIEALFGVLAAFRIRGPEYGTRCSTVLLRDSSGRVQYAERGVAPDGTEQETRRFEFAAA
jgi:uncharacterized protein with NRDE domain